MRTGSLTEQAVNERSIGTQMAGGANVGALPIPRFAWGAGIECSFLPHLNVDQFAWTQHNRFWREDLRLARHELGIEYLRYSFPWHAIEPEPGTFNWTYSDERVEECSKLGINLMLDVMHFGTPLWLKQAVGDPRFPESIERYAEELVKRYRGSIRIWCPFNEPLVSALFSGDFGFWPPHARKWRGYMPVLSRIVQGVSRAIGAIRRAMPEATVLLCDAAENYKTRVTALQQETHRRNLRRFLVMDLLTGRVDESHPLREWLSSFGMSELDMQWFRQNPQSPDIMGLDYYPHSDWQLDQYNGAIRQRRADSPVGLYGIGTAYYQRYGLPMMLTETSVEGAHLNREIWLSDIIDHARKLREEGIPLLGIMWWPMLDSVDWDGALTHRIGKIHQVGLFSLERQADGTLKRVATPLVEQFRAAVADGDTRVGPLDHMAVPTEVEETQEALLTTEEWDRRRAIGLGEAENNRAAEAVPTVKKEGKSNGNGNGNGHSTAVIDPAPGLSAEPTAGEELTTSSPPAVAVEDVKGTDRYGIVVFSHLRWGFVWQRPQQFLSRFARRHQVLFVEEPFFDRAEGSEPDFQLHRVMPNVTVLCVHCAPSLARDPRLPELLREWTRQGIEAMNDDGVFDRPLLWYYSPMDSAWSLGYVENRGIVYDCMDELSQFTGAPSQLVENERRLMEHSDVVFTGGYELGSKKKQQHSNVHVFGCGVEFEHFARAQEPRTVIPADIDFMARPILGYVGVVDERLDYAMVGEMARLRPDWSFAMVGPVVKVDPNLLPHSPNLFWMGGRDYQVLPNYLAAFDICMMPFAMNAATQFINPTKALEYFATGRPVISTPVRDVVRQYSDLAEIVKGTSEFLAAAERVLNTPDLEKRRRAMELARANSWDNTVKTMQGLIKEAIRPKDRRSAKKIEPMSQVEMAYSYQHTQGS